MIYETSARAGKSATVNTLVGRGAVESRRCAAAVTQRCRVACGEGVIVLDTPGLGDPSVDAASIVACVRGAAKAIDDELASCSDAQPARFAAFFVVSCAQRLGDCDVAALAALRFALGSGWRQQVSVQRPF